MFVWQLLLQISGKSFLFWLMVDMRPPIFHTHSATPSVYMHGHIYFPVSLLPSHNYLFFNWGIKD